jgi:chromosome segregation ATPase
MVKNLQEELAALKHDHDVLTLNYESLQEQFKPTENLYGQEIDMNNVAEHRIWELEKSISDARKGARAMQKEFKSIKQEKELLEERLREADPSTIGDEICSRLLCTAARTELTSKKASLEAAQLSESKIQAELNYQFKLLHTKTTKHDEAIKLRGKAISEQAKSEEAVKRLEAALAIEKERMESATRHLNEAGERFRLAEQQYQEDNDLLEAEMCSVREEMNKARHQCELLTARVKSLEEEKKRAASQPPPRFSAFDSAREEGSRRRSGSMDSPRKERKSRSVGARSDHSEDSDQSGRSRSLSAGRRSNRSDSAKNLRKFRKFHKVLMEYFIFR